MVAFGSASKREIKNRDVDEDGPGWAECRKAVAREALAVVNAAEDAGENASALRMWASRGTVRRFAVADNGDAKKAAKRMRDTMQWRRQTRPERVFCRACVGKDLAAHYMFHAGYDRVGRPIVYSDIGLARAKDAKSNVEHCVQVLEGLEPFLRPPPLDKYIWICDFHGFTIFDTNPRLAVSCVKLLSNHYPERMGQMIFIGAPTIFAGLYALCCRVADPVTVGKMRFATGPDGKGGGEPFDDVMRELFDAETEAYLRAEMLDNRKKPKGKSHFAATLLGDDASPMLGDAAAGATGAHDPRGTKPFRISPAVRAMCLLARHGAREVAKGPGPELLARHGLLEDRSRDPDPPGDVDEDGTEWFDARGDCPAA